MQKNNLMPAVFVSHGSPMTVLDRGPYAQALAAFGRTAEPRAIAVISAHWQEPGIRIASGAKPKLIYDFGGFPRALYELRYDAPGSPEMASEVKAELAHAGFEAALDEQRGWDHGVWVPLRLMFPEARIPVVAVSLPYGQSPEELYRLGKAIGTLRERGVLIVGSGGIVHNLRLNLTVGQTGVTSAKIKGRVLGADGCISGRVQIVRWVLSVLGLPS